MDLEEAQAKFIHGTRVWWIDTYSSRRIELKEGTVTSRTPRCHTCKRKPPEPVAVVYREEMFQVFVVESEDEKCADLIPIGDLFKRKSAAEKAYIGELKDKVSTRERTLDYDRKRLIEDEEKLGDWKITIEQFETGAIEKPDPELPKGWKLVEREESPQHEHGCDFSRDRRIIIRKGKDTRLEIRPGFTGWVCQGRTGYYEMVCWLYGKGRGHGHDTTHLFEGGRITHKRLKEHLGKIRKHFKEPGLELSHIDFARTLVIPERKKGKR